VRTFLTCTIAALAMSIHEGTYLADRRRATARHEQRRRRRVAAFLVIAAFVATGVVSSLIDPAHVKPSHPTRDLHLAALELAAIDFRIGLSSPEGTKEDRAISRVMSYTPYVASGGRRRREIALTFDDGPGPYTFAVLRQLRRVHAPATFFEVGRMLPIFRAAGEAVRHRYPVGDHTLSHRPMAALSPALQRVEVLEAAVRLRTLGNRFPRLFRPPYASFNAATISAARSYRMLMVLWSIDSRDYTRPGARQIVKRVLSLARPGAIVLMHDAGGPRDQTVAAIPTIVRKLRQRGYRFVTVPRMMVDAPPPRARRQRLPPGAGHRG
jgi:peptidoglycan/xylan/chitin deacetylase (PgdA/CDA1 family)